jgi:hypothetical protein
MGLRISTSSLALEVAVLVAVFGCSDTAPDGAVEVDDYRGSSVPTRPAEAFDLERIAAATLAELQWREVASRTDSGVEIVDGEWSPGTYTGPRAGGGPLETIRMKSAARLYRPVAAAGPVPVIVVAAHHTFLIPESEAYHLQIAGQLGVALLVHGESPDDAAALGYDTTTGAWRGLMVDEGLASLTARNACAAVDLVTSNYPYALARTNLLALTLAERLLEAEGMPAGEAGLFGTSKEGFATWIASAADARIRVAAPGAFQRLDLQALSTYEENSGCGPNGASTVVDVPALLAMRDWMASTPEGAAAARILLVSEFVADLHPEFLSLNGDVGMSGWHDGIFFTIGTDTHFLDGLSARPWRYDRWAGPGDAPAERFPRQLALLARVLTSPERAVEVAGWVRLATATAVDLGEAGLAFTATVQADPDVAHVRLRWAESPDRELNDADQAEWNTVEMVPSGQTGEYVTPAPIVPSPGSQVAWFAEVEESVAVESTPLARLDASQIRLARPLAPLSCGTVIPIACEP